MVLDPYQAASTRRIAARALFLVVPLALGAIAMARVGGPLRAARKATADVAAAQGAQAGTPPTAEVAPPARPPESPTPEQIEKAYAATKALGEAQRGWQRVEVFAPSPPAAPGVEQTAPFQGFGLSLESEPDGASVTVDGRTVGETPLLAGHRCEPGATVKIRVARDPFPARELTTLCRADTLVKLRVRLGP